MEGKKGASARSHGSLTSSQIAFTTQPASPENIPSTFRRNSAPPWLRSASQRITSLRLRRLVDPPSCNCLPKIVDSLDRVLKTIKVGIPAMVKAAAGR